MAEKARANSTIADLIDPAMETPKERQKPGSASSRHFKALDDRRLILLSGHLA